MRLSFTETATNEEREAVAAAAARRDLEPAATPGGLVLEGPVSAEDALVLAAMPGVAEVAPEERGSGTLYDAVLAWVAGAAAVLGVLAVVAANIPATVGVKADPLRTPGVLRPSWPLLAWYSAVDRAPSWLPVPLFLVLALVALVFWPNVAGRLAEKKPALHTACGIAAIAALLALVALEVMR